MKRFLAMVLAVCMMASMALAEEKEEKSVWDSVGGWLNQAWKDTSDWVSQKWPEVSKWVENAWGDASKWVEKSWKDAPQWLQDTWGDVSTWARETYETASGAVTAWWTETFETVTPETGNPWSWIKEEAAAYQQEELETLSKVKETVAAEGSAAEAKVKEMFISLLKKMALNDEDTEKVWFTIESFAEYKGVSKLAACKLALPYLFQLTVDSARSAEPIPAIAVAQYLTAIVEKYSVNTTETANTILKQLNEALGEIV